MADIFLSYANEDREAAAALAQALEAAGWTVWWEPEIAPGQTWNAVSADAINDARHVIVLWSSHSVTSPRIAQEAEQGRALGKSLIPVRIEAVEPPSGFRMIQAADLTDWRRSADDPKLRDFLAELKSLRGPAHRAQPAPAPSYRPPGLGSIVLGTAAAVAGAVKSAIDLLRPKQRAMPPYPIRFFSALPRHGPRVRGRALRRALPLTSPAREARHRSISSSSANKMIASSWTFRRTGKIVGASELR